MFILDTLQRKLPQGKQLHIIQQQHYTEKLFRTTEKCIYI